MWAKSLFSISVWLWIPTLSLKSTPPRNVLVFRKFIIYSPYEVIHEAFFIVRGSLPGALWVPSTYEKRSGKPIPSEIGFEKLYGGELYSASQRREFRPSFRSGKMGPRKSDGGRTPG